MAAAWFKQAQGTDRGGVHVEQVLQMHATIVKESWEPPLKASLKGQADICKMAGASARVPRKVMPRGAMPEGLQWGLQVPAMGNTCWGAL